MSDVKASLQNTATLLTGYASNGDAGLAPVCGRPLTFILASSFIETIQN